MSLGIQRNSNTIPISVTIIAHNEEHCIGRCLQSVFAWVSEIILVLNDSTDKTEEIARNYAAKIYEHSWHGHRDQKNIALKYARYPWILAIDADEEISPDLALEIREFLTIDSQYLAASFPRMSWFLGKWIRHGDWYPDRKIRLIRQGSGKWGGSTEHDRLVVEGKVKKLQEHLLHYSNPTINSQINKINYFSDIFLQRQLQERKKWSATNTVFRASWRFFRCYFLKLGFFDGYAGFYIASHAGFSTLVRYTRLYEFLMLRKRKESARNGRFT